MQDSGLMCEVDWNAVLMIATNVVIAAATGALGWYAYVQNKALGDEKARHGGRLKARGGYYGLLVRRSLRAAVRSLDDNPIQHDTNRWHTAVGGTSAALGQVQDDFEQMLESTLEFTGGSSADLQEMLDCFVAACDAFNDMARFGAEQPPGDLQKQLDAARKQSICCWGVIERVFNLQPQQPHSFGKPLVQQDASKALKLGHISPEKFREANQ